MTSPPLDTTNLLWRAHANGIHHGAINFWVGMLSSVLDPVGSTTRVLEFGSTGSEFFRLLHLAFEYKEATGILLAVDGPDRSAEWLRPSGPACRFVHEDAGVSLETPADIAFSQEIVSLLPDLRAHAANMRALLSPSGVYYATVGWHLDNPATASYAASRASEGKPFHGHCLADITAAFEAEEFEVGFKRLQVPYFLIHDRAIATSRFGGVARMMEALQDWKVLFQFRKWRPR